ncbi:hypothetical protein ABIE26_002224 [Pedobacter africanus]|uniref:Uncharacterized protein n=1 Tax=Pedobacter africanus TaxID=151894 RepID=A0ACC6KZ24_9SPHI|nr:hypothetical protein [Pedobacter africanus]MDR6784387.1 hypothetical protein [Pedobacter africanus]
MTKNKKEETSAIFSLMSVFPPLALLFIVAGWFKQRKVSALSFAWAATAILLSIVFVVQLYKPL